MSVASMAVAGSTSVGLVGLHIHAEPARSVTNPMAASRSGDRHETSGGSGFGDAIGDRRVWNDVVCTAAPSFIPILFPPIGVTRLDISEADF